MIQIREDDYINTVPVMRDKRPKKDNDATYTKLRSSYKMVRERNKRE